ncbi:DUF1275 family protein [Microvirga sp. 3-52]|uniref:DUF1275 family protein n=1 Tax=Microvirga sp. 3-52 TaxID=2792425 RepID=UPI0024BEFCC7|nr:DUF1275 family protein [Microvirga sp. 3-52]
MRRWALSFSVISTRDGLTFLAVAVNAVAHSLESNREAMLLLCFIMGQQNATMTKISGARIRMIHTIGMITDARIEGRKRVDWNRGITRSAMPLAHAGHPKPRLQSLSELLMRSREAYGVFTLPRHRFSMRQATAHLCRTEPR